jgi:chemotaxis protein MotB
MRGKGAKGDRGNAIIVRKEEIVEGGSHGGAWKVAYADFVTAMMAFFLLLWLINTTTEDQRRGIADYFTPSNAWSHASSGSGQPFGGHTPFDQGELVSDRGAEAVRRVETPPDPDTVDPDVEHPPSEPAPAPPPPSTATTGQPAVVAGNAATELRQDGTK